MRIVKPRRGGSSSSLGNTAGAPGGGRSAGAGGHDQQLLLRDRRSRLAARALRSSGGFFDLKGMAGAGWLAGAAQEQPEPELRVVVKVAERDRVVDPPAVPACLTAFLSARQGRRSHEVRRGYDMGAHRKDNAQVIFDYFGCASMNVALDCHFSGFQDAIQIQMPYHPNMVIKPLLQWSSRSYCYDFDGCETNKKRNVSRVGKTLLLYVY